MGKIVAFSHFHTLGQLTSPPPPSLATQTGPLDRPAHQLQLILPTVCIGNNTTTNNMPFIQLKGGAALKERQTA